MTFFSTALAFVVTLGLLIVFHEFGHYLMARWCGVKVLRFSIGFGQPLLSKRWGKDQTEWVIAAFPLGGYVKMLDEREGSVAPQELPQSFNRKPVAHRFAIVAAGPAANFLLAILLYWLLFMLGVAAIKPVIGTVPPATPAAFAGFERGETITKIGGEPVTTWQDARWLLLSHVVDQSSPVTVETINPLGHVNVRQVDVTDIQPDDLDGDFLKKIGLTIYQPDMEPIIAQVTPESAGSRAGLRAGDRILEVNRKQIALWEELVQEIRANPGTLLRLRIQRNSETVSIEVVPDTATEGSEKVGKLGIGPKIDQAEFEKLMVEISYAAGHSHGQGNQQNVGNVRIYLADAGENAGRTSILEECQRTDNHCRLRREIGPDGGGTVSRLSGAYQHQPRRAEPVTHTGTGWWTFNVLCDRNYKGQSAFCKNRRDWSTGGDGAVIRPDGFCHL